MIASASKISAIQSSKGFTLSGVINIFLIFVLYLITSLGILDADAIILGPGSLYTSILPNLKICSICDAININKGVKIYISNIMTQPGETDDYTLYDHVISIFKNTNILNIDYVIANNKTLNNYVLEKYNCKNSKQVICDDDKLCEINTKVIKKNLIKIKNNFIRHDGEKLSKLIIDIVNIN